MVLLITGTVGVGKTTVAEAVGDILVGLGVPHAVIDLDELRRCWPPPAGDRFNDTVELTNLRSVAANYRAAGALRLVLAGVVERRSQRQDYERAVGCAVQVVRLRADPAVLAERLRERHRGDPGGLGWHLARAPQLSAILEEAVVADVEVETTGQSVGKIASDVLAAASWEENPDRAGEPAPS